jgi:hypothetical protein
LFVAAVTDLEPPSPQASFAPPWRRPITNKGKTHANERSIWRSDTARHQPDDTAIGGEIKNTEEMKCPGDGTVYWARFDSKAANTTPAAKPARRAKP